jgi:hypothetical protein
VRRRGAVEFDAFHPIVLNLAKTPCRYSDKARGSVALNSGDIYHEWTQGRGPARGHEARSEEIVRYSRRPDAAHCAEGPWPGVDSAALREVIETVLVELAATEGHTIVVLEEIMYAQ